MWKVLVIICMVGYDCTAFQQSPMQYYHSYDECINIAIEKQQHLTNAYTENSYYVIDTKATCEKVPAT